MHKLTYVLHSPQTAECDLIVSIIQPFTDEDEVLRLVVSVVMAHERLK